MKLEGLKHSENLLDKIKQNSAENKIINLLKELEKFDEISTSITQLKLIGEYLSPLLKTQLEELIVNQNNMIKSIEEKANLALELDYYSCFYMLGIFLKEHGNAKYALKFFKSLPKDHEDYEKCLFEAGNIYFNDENDAKKIKVIEVAMSCHVMQILKMENNCIS